MQSYSNLSKLVTKAVELDPEAEKLLKEFAKAGEVEQAQGSFFDAIRRIERESKAFVVSAPGTTMRNLMGTAIGMTFQTASRLFEGTIYTTGKAIKNLLTGNTTAAPLEKSMGDFVKDAFSSWTYLTNQGITAEVVDEILQYNPKVKQQLFSALQESGNDKLSWLAKFVNKGNVAQDVLFRRALFTSSVEKQLRDVGLNMYDILAQGKVIPADVVKNAADDALKGTFAFMPKTGASNTIVRSIEKIPLGSLVIPFPRFMANAMRFQWQYMPLVAARNALSEAGSAAMAVAKKDPMKAEAMFRKASQSFGDGLVGTAAMLAAYQYRSENQDIKWNEMKQEDGSVIDTRAIFPAAPYLWLGEMMYQVFDAEGDASKVKLKEGFETIVGMKAPSGTTMAILEGFPEMLEAMKGIVTGEDFDSKEVEKIQEQGGKILGSFLTRFVQPTVPITDFLDLYKKESMTGRDPNVVDTEDRFSDTVQQQVYARLFGLKETLPEAKSRTREEPPVRAGNFLSQLTGLRFQAPKNALEKEFVSLGMEDYRIYTPTGDKVLDRAVIDQMVPYLTKNITALINSDSYQKLAPKERRRTLEKRIAVVMEQEELNAMRPDLTGEEIMDILGLKPGPQVGKAYKYLLELRIENGPLGPEKAKEALLEWHSKG
jgi:hypothetical protein